MCGVLFSNGDKDGKPRNMVTTVEMVLGTKIFYTDDNTMAWGPIPNPQVSTKVPILHCHVYSAVQERVY